jgi:hypothetical protein
MPTPLSNRELLLPSLLDRVPSPTRSTRPVAARVSISISIMSPSTSRPIGPPASPSGPTWPMQAPVDTPEKRASVTSATVVANGSCLSALVT